MEFKSAIVIRLEIFKKIDRLLSCKLAKRRGNEVDDIKLDTLRTCAPLSDHKSKFCICHGLGSIERLTEFQLQINLRNRKRVYWLIS